MERQLCSYAFYSANVILLPVRRGPQVRMEPKLLSPPTPASFNFLIQRLLILQSSLQSCCLLNWLPLPLNHRSTSHNVLPGEKCQSYSRQESPPENSSDLCIPKLPDEILNCCSFFSQSSSCSARSCSILNHACSQFVGSSRGGSKGV